MAVRRRSARHLFLLLWSFAQQVLHKVPRPREKDEEKGKRSLQREARAPAGPGTSVDPSGHSLPKAAASADTFQRQVARGGNSSCIFRQFNITLDTDSMQTCPRKHEATAPFGTSDPLKRPAAAGRNPGFCTGDCQTLALTLKQKDSASESRDEGARCRLEKSKREACGCLTTASKHNARSDLSNGCLGLARRHFNHPVSARQSSFPLRVAGE